MGRQDLDGGDNVVMGRLLFSYCFLEIFVGQDFDGVRQSRDGRSHRPPLLRKTLQANIFGPRPFIVESLKEA